MRHDQEIALANKYGATYCLDPQRGGPYCQFQLNGWVIWECIHKGRPRWATATVSFGHFVKHAYHDTLHEALERAAVTVTP